MGKVFRLSRELNLLMSCFGLSELYSRLASLNSGTGTVLCAGSVTFNLREKSLAPSLYPGLGIQSMVFWSNQSFFVIERSIWSWKRLNYSRQSFLKINGIDGLMVDLFQRSTWVIRSRLIFLKIEKIERLKIKRSKDSIPNPANCYYDQGWEFDHRFFVWIDKFL